MNGSVTANCTFLATRSSFPAYMQAIRGDTGFNATLLSLCKPEVCNALWGTGNADISGIGMIFGYLFSHFLGFSFALCLNLIYHSNDASAAAGTDSRKKFRAVVLRGASIFFDCALYFAASIQIACVVVLVRKDFGISANGLGGLTVQITWAVAVLSMLPLLYPLVMLGVLVKRADEVSEKELAEAESSSARHELRFYLFCACWCLFLYTFVSMMIGYFAPSQIGVGNGEAGTTVVTVPEWNTLVELCLVDTQQLSDVESRIFEAFGATGSIVLSLFVVAPLLTDVMRGAIPQSEVRIERLLSKFRGRIKWVRGISYTTAMLILIPILTVPEIWGFFRIRSVQQEMSDAIGSEYVDNQWTFGQVVAVVIFAPVLVEVLYMYVQSNSH